ncbi:MAG: phosphomannomutase/phosphoglucomutase [Acidimicrobiia bacterium]|nr:phosphomannomutase/phosphoglucomutase [Acidimicrobiia bacterium]
MAIPIERLEPIFKAYDIRGTVPDQIDAEVVTAIGAGFARFASLEGGPAERILIGHDMRPSGPDLARAFAEGVTSQGIDVVHLGLCSTDEVFFAAGHFDAPAAQLTASHNPAEYNGIKLCLAGARPVGVESGLEQIKADAAGGLPAAATIGTVSTEDALGPFVTHVHSFVDRSVLRPRRLVADAGNGMGGLVAPAVFEGLPFDLEMLYGELDGTFPNHPANPIEPENLVDLQAKVRSSGADVGLAFDGDADRVFLVDEQGELLSGSTTTAIVAVEMLKRHPGATVLYNLICSRSVPEVITEHGGTPVRTRVGHSYIKAVMAETGAAFGGEHSGHYYFADNYRADSGIIAALVVLQALCVADVPLSELRRPFERYADSGEINTRVTDPHAVIDEVAGHFADHSSDRLDGLTVSADDWWFNLRPSNTEPLLRLNVEASTTDECAQRVGEVRQLIRSADAELTPSTPDAQGGTAT